MADEDDSFEGGIPGIVIADGPGFTKAKNGPGINNPAYFGIDVGNKDMVAGKKLNTNVTPSNSKVTGSNPNVVANKDTTLDGSYFDPGYYSAGGRIQDAETARLNDVKSALGPELAKPAHAMLTAAMTQETAITEQSSSNPATTEGHKGLFQQTTNSIMAGERMLTDEFKTAVGYNRSQWLDDAGTAAAAYFGHMVLSAKAMYELEGYIPTNAEAANFGQMGQGNSAEFARLKMGAKYGHPEWATTPLYILADPELAKANGIEPYNPKYNSRFFKQMLGQSQKLTGWKKNSNGQRYLALSVDEMSRHIVTSYWEPYNNGTIGRETFAYSTWISKFADKSGAFSERSSNWNGKN